MIVDYGGLSLSWGLSWVMTPLESDEEPQLDVSELHRTKTWEYGIWLVAVGAGGITS
jgi:hypothetical protein